MLFLHRRVELMYGAFFGAWLAVTYALVSQVINWLFLPGIPLAPPVGGFTGYLLQYLAMGALLGVISALPENRWAGAALGGLTAAIALSVRMLQSAWGTEIVGTAALAALLMFMPLAVLMMPLAFFVRLGVDGQQRDPDQPYLWARRYIIPIFLTLVVVGAGSLSLYSPQARAAFRYTDQMIRQGQIATAGQKALPEPLRSVNGFVDEARGSYSLAWSDRVETFFGPRPAGRELSQFLIITRFENGFVFACIFSENRPTPNCTNY
jgi:hypothetical protein